MKRSLILSLICLIAISYSCHKKASTKVSDGYHKDHKHGHGHDHGHDHAKGENPHGNNPHATNPHGTNPHGTNPHGDNPHGTNPHTTNPHAAKVDAPQTVHYEQEKHLKNVRQLTFGGDNAEAYFSFDNQMLVWQRTNEKDGVDCDQIFYSNIPKSPDEKLELNLVSTGKGRTTCSYFMPGDEQIIFASTHLSHEGCPPVPDRKEIGQYVWPVYSEFEIFIADKEGNILKQLTDNDYYDAEATLSPDGKKIVFTSTRTGDLELFVMNVDGSDLKQVTSGLGYDGGAFFSPDSKKLLFRASRPQSAEDQKNYKDLLARDMVTPSDMELYVCNVDGSDLKQVTKLGGANWAPFYHPSGEKIIFSSNHQSTMGFPFNLFMINEDGTGLEQITFDNTFDSFPMFSPDGKQFVFASNRNNGGTRDTNVFIADWVE